jgi:hypothetical protein
MGVSVRALFMIETTTMQLDRLLDVLILRLRGARGRA